MERNHRNHYLDYENIISWMPDRPNVLFVCTDQQFAGAMSCAGNKSVSTPSMDRLADNGVLFEEAYCPSPLCTPSRASMVTGRMPHETGVTDNGVELPESYHEKTLGRLFDEAGYECAYAGKWHVPGLEMESSGFERICGQNDLEVADECIEFLQRDNEDPFCLVASFDNPHNICEWARDQNLPWGNIPQVPTDECPSLPANYHPPPFEPEEIRGVIQQNRRTYGAMADVTPEEWRQYRHAYYRLVERVDDEIGRILDSLDTQGLSEETVIVFLSDHGDGHGAHRINQKYFLYEEETRVPFIVDPPGETDSQQVNDDHLVSTGLDLLPTLCDYAGIEPPADLRGRSVRPIVSGQAPDDWRDYVITQTYVPLKGRMVRTDQYKYIVYHRGRNREQLFDMECDRGEMVDLSVDAEYEDVLTDHRERLIQWATETGDIFAERYPSNAPLIPGYDAQELQDRIEGSEPS
jgi:arylsulfatase A-like enzyme